MRFGGKDKEHDSVFIGKLPVMVKSKACHLSLEDTEGLFVLNECPYDQGGYFIINGSEKVLIAQERSAANIVQVFKKAQPSAYSYTAEIRSALEKGSRLISSMMLKLFGKGDSASGGFVQMHLLRQQIEGAVIRLPLSLVRHGHHDRGVAFPPHPATDIAPH